MTWANHPTTKHPIRLHYNCRIKGDTHYFEVGVIPREDRFEVFIPDRQIYAHLKIVMREEKKGL
jgi:hypothetical protein